MKTNVALKLARLSVPRKIEKAKAIVAAMTGNANFPTPSPTLETITQLANGLEMALIATNGGAEEETAAMYARERELDLGLKSLAAYVEGIANVNPEQAEVIILSAAMEVKKRVVRTTSDFDVKSTGNPGEVKIGCRAEDRAAYVFQMTTDPSNEANWSTIHSDVRSKLVRKGLTSGTRYHFRVAVIRSGGQQPWSQTKSVIAS
jgi:hypothetical protein